jgi:acylphosphatase
VNKHTAKYRPDGSVQVVVAAENKSFDNWIDTVGHEEGTMCWRWVRAKENPEPQTRVVKLSEL